MVSDCLYYSVYSQNGYYTLTSKPIFTDNFGYVVKGHSLSVKKQLFDRVRQELDKREISYVDFCSPNGSSGLYSSEMGFHIVDGTFPDSNEPITYGATDRMISLSDYQDCEYLKLKKDIIEECLATKYSEIKRCERFMSATGTIAQSIQRTQAQYVDSSKINRYASKLWQKHAGKLSGRVGMESKRFISCVTANGVEINTEIFDLYCDKVIVLSDKIGACSAAIVDRIRRYALSSGYDIISCICSLNVPSGVEHLIIPELRLGIFSSKFFHRADIKNSKKVFTGKFMEQESGKNKNRIDFSLKACQSLLDEAVMSLKNVKKCDETLDCYYYSATDIKRLNEDVINMIFDE